jgi:hypothetical protein
MVVGPVLVTVEEPRAAKPSIVPARALTVNQERTKTKTSMEKRRNFIFPPIPEHYSLRSRFEAVGLERTGPVILDNLTVRNLTLYGPDVQLHTISA